MPRLLQKQEAAPRSQENQLLDALPINGMDVQAARRAHMRDLTMARQEAERRFSRPAAAVRLYRLNRAETAYERDEALQVELARIDAEHRAWLRAHELAEPPRVHSSRQLPPDIMSPG